MNVIGQSNSFLFEVYAVDFGDNYHRLGNEPSSELEKAARKIRRRYKNYSDFVKAAATYNEYMTRLAIKYGGVQLFKIKLKNDMIDDFVPPKPRMKNTQLNNFILKNKVILSSMKNVHPTENVEEYVEFIDNLEQHKDIEVGIATDSTAKKLMKEDKSILSTKKIKNISSIDLLEEYFKTKNGKQEEERIKKLPSLKEVMSDDYLEGFVDTSEQDDVIFYRGNYMKRDTVDELQVYQKLGDSGWNSLKLMKSKNVRKSITNIMKERDEKDKKKSKKDKKKRRKQDDFLVQIATDNDYDDFGQFEEEMLDFTADNVFNR